MHLSKHPESDICFTKNNSKKAQLFFFFPRLQPITSLSRTNYAECKCRSPSDGLCCRGSLEGRSFIPFSTSIYPRGFCSSVAQRVPLLMPFHLLCFHLWLCVWLWGWEGRRKAKSVWRNRCVLWFMHISVSAHAGYRLHALFSPQCLSCTCKQGDGAHRSRNTHFSFSAISKVLNGFP